MEGGVCIQGGDGSASMGSASVGLHLRGGWADPPPRDTWDTKGYDQQASGMYPTGMHSSPFTSSFMFCFSFSTRKVATAECILF